MSNGKGLSILALLIGISGLGLGIYTFVFPPVQVQVVDTNFGIQNTWFKYDPTIYGTNPINTDIIIEPLIINFTVNLGESVYFLFNAWAGAFGALVSILQVHFVLDGVLKAPPDYPLVTFGSDNVDQYGSVTLQVAKTITAGSHNITISIIGNYASNGISESTLMVQTFFP
ncbi:MAG: hypothetical protein ACFFEY_09050 [Candidatus Thorarchaeota archaeon]